MIKPLSTYTSKELQDELERRIMNPTQKEKDAEKERSKQMLLTRLLKEEPKAACSMWEIQAEDENPDMGGSHHQKRLAVVTGSYRKACEYAITLKGFVGWGYGGNVVPIKQEDFIELGD